MALAPGWSAPVESLFNRLMGDGKSAEAELVASDLLASNPNQLWALEAMAGLATAGNRGVEALGYWQRALDSNPLDRRLRVLTAHATLAAARAQLGKAAEAAATLEVGRVLCADAFPIGFHALYAVVLQKLGRGEEAERERLAAYACPGARLAVAYTTAVDSGLVKLKPAGRKAADGAFQEALLPDPDPLEVNLLYGVWDSYAIAGIKYRGQKTHEKTILELCPRTLASAGKPADYENLLHGLVAREQWKVAEKLAAPLERRFPTSAGMKVCLAEVMHTKRARYTSELRLDRLLDEATAILDTAGEPDPRAEQLRSRIAALRGRFDSAAVLLDFFADRRR
jgi:tetratricopeptide (TPR) repeat protein